MYTRAIYTFIAMAVFLLPFYQNCSHSSLPAENVSLNSIDQDCDLSLRNAMGQVSTTFKNTDSVYFYADTEPTGENIQLWIDSADGNHLGLPLSIGNGLSPSNYNISFSNFTSTRALVAVLQVMMGTEVVKECRQYFNIIGVANAVTPTCTFNIQGGNSTVHAGQVLRLNYSSSTKSALQFVGASGSPIDIQGSYYDYNVGVQEGAFQLSGKMQEGGIWRDCVGSPVEIQVVP